MLKFTETLPSIELAFAYGSGAFHQPKLYQSGDTLPLLDFIVAVHDPLDWHTQNLVINPSHYSGLAQYGPKMIEFLSKGIGIGLHFNTYVPYQDRFVKYGVISVNDLRSDLLTWRHLYISGRLHKPVLWIKQAQELMNEIHYNNQAALAAALILSPRSFNEMELYQQICQLSYTGDIRMQFAEDKDKIQRIVQGSFYHFQTLYNNSLTNEITEAIHLQKSNEGIYHLDPSTKHNLLPFLPKSVRDGMNLMNLTPSSLHTELRSILSSRVSLSSRRQALAGLFGIGLWKGTWYLKEKMKKSWTSSLIKRLRGV
eukprot:g1910.t1